MLKFVDTHIHFWNLNVLRYPWLESDAWRHLSDVFEPAHLRAASDDILATVHVQAEMDHARHPVRETEWLHSLRSKTDPASPIPTVAVGYADLTKRDLSDVLDRHQEFDFFRGVRQEAWYSPNASGGGTEHNVDLLAHPAWTNGLKEVARRKLTFDLLVYAHQLRQAADIFSKVPDLPVVLDHLGHPASAVDRDTWLRDLSYFKERVPNAFIKLSGISFVGATIEDPVIRNRVLDALDIFGTERSMLASNYPVDKTLGTYSEIWQALEKITSGLSAGDRSQIFVETAKAFYHIKC